MNYFITLEATSKKDYDILLSLIENHKLPLNELGITQWDSNIDNRRKMLNSHNNALRKHLKSVAKDNVF